MLLTGLFPAISEKAPGQNWEKMIALTSKLGDYDIEHNKGSKIDPQNQVILDCIMPSIPLKHKCFSFNLIWVIVVVVSKEIKKKKKKKKNIGKNRHGIGKKGGYFRLGMGPNSAPRERQKIPW